MIKKELKNQKGIYVIKIEGFLTHLNTDLLNTSHGFFIIFMRSSKDKPYSIEKSRCDYYNDEIFYFFFSGMQKLRYPCMPTPEITIVF